MTKLIDAFCNFENAPKTLKTCKLKLKYNYSIINDFSSKTPPSTYPTQGSFSMYFSFKELPNKEKLKKKLM